MRKLKTHTFRFGRYHIEFAHGLDGCCDIPDEPGVEPRLDMIVLEGNTLKALNTSIHEAMHAEGISDEYVHDGSPDRIASFLWRKGWRLVKK